MEKEKKIKKTEVIKKIFVLEFENQTDLASTFLRFQEHYESPEFKGKFFSLDEYKAWYTQIKGGFTYYTDWGGFNIPSYVLKPFYEGKFNPLTLEENQILELFRNTKEPFYIIGLYKNNENIESNLNHEIAHGLFYTEPEYKNKVLKILEKYNFDELKNWLSSLGGYHENVLLDEVYAYSIFGSKKYQGRIDETMKKELTELFEEWKNKRI